MAGQFNQSDIFIGEVGCAGLVGEVQHADDPVLANERRDYAVLRPIIVGVGSLRFPDSRGVVCIDVRNFHQLFCADRHNHRGWRGLVERDDFVNHIRMAGLLQVENAGRLIEDVKGSEVCANNFWYPVDADFGYTLYVEAVNLPGQGRNLLKERYAVGGAGRVIDAGFAIFLHSPQKYGPVVI